MRARAAPDDAAFSSVVLTAMPPRTSRRSAQPSRFASARAARTSRLSWFAAAMRNRHSAALSVVRVLALLRDRRRAVLRPAPARRALRAAATSYYFYARWNAWYVALPLDPDGERFSHRPCARALARERAAQPRLLLALGVAANLAFLGTFKYANFASGTVAALLGMHENPWLVNLFVPIGISFHTFQSISYLVDVYRGRTAAIRKPLDYALYLAFFPQLLAGPIVRAGLFFGELFAWRPPGPDDVSYGLARAGFGLLKKMAIADQFAGVANALLRCDRGHPGAPAAWSAMFAFAMQIYFDFSGYSDIAIGCARLFGFVFPENFSMPYLATSVTDFWHRWHITLSTWLRDYLYIPLGGNRHGGAATLRNLMLTMLLGGLWHGAQWTFVAWGGFHGVMLCVERLTGIGHERVAPRGIVALARIVLTFVARLAGVGALPRADLRDGACRLSGAFRRRSRARVARRMAGGAGGRRSSRSASATAAATARIAPAGLQLRPLAQVGALAGLLLALELFRGRASRRPSSTSNFKADRVNAKCETTTTEAIESRSSLRIAA